MKGPITRILLRYGAAALVTWGVLSPGLGNNLAYDPDVIAVTEVVVGVGIAAAVEGYYWLAKRHRWTT